MVGLVSPVELFSRVGGVVRMLPWLLLRNCCRDSIVMGVSMAVAVVAVQMQESMESVPDSWHGETPLAQKVKWMVSTF